MKPVICYLSKSDTDTILSLQKSLQLLFTNFNNTYNIPTKIFVENDFPTNSISDLQREFNVEFITITLSPSRLFAERPIVFSDATNYSIGYRNMCQFFFSEIYSHLTEYDWFMRLDADSFITNKIGYNIFEFLEKKNCVYGFIGEMPEWKPATLGLDTFFNNLIEKHNISPKFYDKFVKDGVYILRQIYNNCEIIKLDYFNRPLVKLLMDEVNASGNIYKFRWGDAPLRSLILSLTCEMNELHRFRDIDYEHVAFVQKNGEDSCSWGPPEGVIFSEWVKNNDWLIT